MRCWTIREGWKAPQAAGTIHTDFERGFIKAEVYNYADFKELGSEEVRPFRVMHRTCGGPPTLRSFLWHVAIANPCQFASRSVFTVVVAFIVTLVIGHGAKRVWHVNCAGGQSERQVPAGRKEL